MMNNKKIILSCREYGEYTSLPNNQDGSKSNFEFKANQIAIEANTKDAISYSGNKFRFQKVAGILSIDSKYELEICPKFLDIDRPWKKDFFSIALLTSYGKIYPDSLLGGFDTDNTLGDLLAMIFIAEYNKNSKNPIRNYNQKFINSFSITGNIDWGNNFPVPSNGFNQKLTTYSAYNSFNHVLKLATLKLQTITTNIYLKKQLLSISNQLNIHKKLSDFPQKLNRKDSKWSDTYQLSLNILKDTGISYFGKNISSMPGFILRTDYAWEELTRKILLAGYPGLIKKDNFDWGTTIRSGQRIKNLKVHPDIILYDKDNNIRLLIDAKYKGDRNKESIINRNDIYEMYSFLVATKSKVGIIVYPNHKIDSETGDIAIFETCQFYGDIVILGLKITISGISSRNGFKTIVDKLKTFIESMNI